METDTFFDGYVTCALWLADENPGSGEWAQHDEYTVSNIAPETLAKMRADCADFQEEYSDILTTVYLFGDDYDESKAGHDFWLSRNGHGAGYFDRGDEYDWTYLQNAAKSRGEHNLYIGDDGMIYGG